MDSILDTLPFDYSAPEARALRDLLAEIYYRDTDITAVAEAAKFPVGEIPYGDNARMTWHGLLTTARKRNLLKELIHRILDDPRASAYQQRIAELISPVPPVLPPEELLLDGQALLDAIPRADLEYAEQQTGDRPTLKDISFLHGALRVAPGVVRLRVGFSQGSFTGTGFLIFRDVVLTNFHVLFDKKHRDERAYAVEVWFDYETGPDGSCKKEVIFEADPATAVGDKRLDWAVIKLPRPAPAHNVPLLLAPGRRMMVGEEVCIIQHPDGKRKKIAMEHNTVVYVDTDHLRYLTDTEGGSSGSPVFDNKWRVIGLHRSAGEVMFNGERRVVNIGTPIQAVVDGLGKAGIRFDSE
ncbi:trypsin-like peptidase domain-containing protein [Nonomuraea sp. NPDC050202]|uniref:trypsin-like peptidase domain-containing protein n=1 Tax=Nonomuraea sp. NPDC050202 TaxID=3155035 RepID=UPI0033FEEF77